MNRRNFLIGLGACGVAAGLTARASALPSCRIIGIGGTGCKLVVALRASNIPSRRDLAPDFLCIDTDPYSLRSVEAATIGSALPPIKTLMLAPFGSGGGDQAQRVACSRKPVILAKALSGADAVILVSGLGGSTGSGVTPIMAWMARTMGVPTAVAAITPFDFEGARSERATQALKHLRREAGIVMEFSNIEWANRFSDDTPLIEVFDALERQIAMDVSSLIAAWSRAGVRI